MDNSMDNFAECGNCGGTDDLMRCSRCRSEWFCSRLCQKAYWPFHRDSCKKNEFADALEQLDPKMAVWMRKHGKLAVLRDDEVDRLERASKAPCGAISREDLLISMYGRIEPKPLPPSYSLEEIHLMQAKYEEERRQGYVMSSQDKAWQAINIPEGLGRECARYKFRQNLSHVEMYCLVPHGIDPKKVKVVIQRKHLSVRLNSDDKDWIKGELLKEVDVFSSTWYIVDGVVHISLLKILRKGRYQKNTCNADTWWRSLMTKAGPSEVIAMQYPPTRYYSGDYEELDLKNRIDYS